MGLNFCRLTKKSVVFITVFVMIYFQVSNYLNMELKKTSVLRDVHILIK